MTEFEFDISPWEEELNQLQENTDISALHLIELLENEEDDAFTDAFQILTDKSISIDLSTLPKTVFSGEAGERLRYEEALAASGFCAAELEEKDTLRIYLEELALIPKNADDTEETLAKKILGGNSRASELLTNMGLSRVVELAQEYVGYGVLLLDLIQEGNIGLWESVSTYSGGDYALYRDYRIRSAFARTILLQAKNAGISGKMKDLLSDYRTVDEKLLTDLGRNPTPEELAEGLHISVEEVEAIQKMLSDAMLVKNAKEPAESPEDEEISSEQAVEDTAYYQMRQRISDLLSQLNDTDARILTLRFGLDRSAPLSAEAVAAKLGISVREVTKREAAALQSLRQ